MISQAKGYRAKRHGPWQASRTVWRCLEALLCLLILMAQLTLIVAHSWEVFLEEGAVATTRVSRAFLKDATDAPTISKVAVVPRRNAHDPLLCPTCQLLAQAKNGLTPHGPEVSLPETSCTGFLDCSCRSSALDLAVSAPRAPPYFL